MKRTIRHNDLIMLRDYAVRFISSFPNGGKLDGMHRKLTESEVQALAFLDAALTVLGLPDVEIKICVADSDTAFDE